MITPELAPYAKTGGLADMVAALSDELKKNGHDVRIVLPLYGLIKKQSYTIETTLDSMCVTMGVGEEWCAIRNTKTESDIPVYLVEMDSFFDRMGLYHDSDCVDYPDNPQRFGFFSRAALQVVIDTDFKPDIIHVHDWQTALVPFYLKTWFWNHPTLGQSASVLTIHNAAFQGLYPMSNDTYLDIKEKDFNSNTFEDHKRISFLKGGIYYSDMINTVSPNHAKEITTPHGGFGLAPYISNRGDSFCGILNGVDYSQWSPGHDPYLASNFSKKKLSGKKICKKQLQELFELDINTNIATIGIVGRLTLQKGHNLILKIIEDVLDNMHVQFAILGSGDKDLESFFGSLPSKYPGRIGTHIGFSNERAHIIEAGADFFLMPSLFEPCGLNQMYSLRYGTLPIVRGVGGLNDTIDNYDESTGLGTGFKFIDDSPAALYYTIGWAISTYYDRPFHMKQLIQQAMSMDFSWKHATKDYLNLYDSALGKKKEYDVSWMDKERL